MPKSLSLGLIIVSFIIGIGAGYALSPEYAEMMTERQSGRHELGAADRNLDRRFINNMIAHHLTAIDLSKQALENSQREEIKQLAQTIIMVDEEGIDKLYQMKQEYYNDTKEVTNYQKINLGTADENFDLRFLNALINHHQEAIESTAEVQTKSTRNEVLTLASQANQGLQQSLEALRQMRAQWYSL